MSLTVDNKSGRIMLVDEPPTYDEVGSGQLLNVLVYVSLFLVALSRPSRCTQSSVDSREQLSLDIVSHCARACVAHSIDFGAIIQRHSMEKHSPLYWAVVNGRDDSLVLALLRHACPVSDAAQSDLRWGCLVAGSTVLFDAISHELHAQMNYSDRMLLTNAPPDVAKVHTHADPTEGFDVFLELHCFYKRMVAGRKVLADFITHGRVWRLSLLGGGEGREWVVKFETLENAGPDVEAFPVHLSFVVGTTPFEVELKRLYRGDKCVYGFITGYPIQYESAPDDDDVLCATLSVPGPFPKPNEA
ncbi:hypothetical protein BDZ89DRAFT_1166589 [Hymenopellis radicata]|nr:hypothetical protein BDZ89DRAFT_1166589 [Hymenopellis radicata]